MAACPLLPKSPQEERRAKHDAVALGNCPMIRLMFISAYPMKEQIRRILASFPLQEEIDFRCAVHTFDELTDYSLKWPCEAVIARGYSAEVLEKRNLSAPVLQMNFTSNEEVKAIIECQKKFRSREIAVISHPTLSLADQTINQITDIMIHIYTQDSVRGRTGELVDRAVRDGCDTIIGGGAAYKEAKKRRVNAYLIKSDDETVWNAMDKAVKTVIIQRQERERAAILRTVMDNVREGLMLIGSDGSVEVANQFAAKLLHLNPADCVGRSVAALLPELSRQLERAQRHRANSNHEIVTLNGKSYTVAFTPIILNGDAAKSLLAFQDIGNLQEMERQVRSKMFARDLATRYTFDDIVHSGRKMRRTVEMAKRFAGVDSNVLVEGETGTGKEMIAQSIHSLSRRGNRPFVAVKCAAMPASLLESELF